MNIVKRVKNKRHQRRKTEHAIRTNPIISDGDEIKDGFKTITPHLFNPRLKKELMTKAKKNLNEENVECLIDCWDMKHAKSNTLNFGQIRNLYKKYISGATSQNPDFTVFVQEDTQVNISYQMRLEFTIAHNNYLRSQKRKIELSLKIQRVKNIHVKIDMQQEINYLEAQQKRMLDNLYFLIQKTAKEVVKLVKDNRLIKRKEKKKPKRSLQDIFKEQ